MSCARIAESIRTLGSYALVLCAAFCWACEQPKASDSEPLHVLTDMDRMRSRVVLPESVGVCRYVGGAVGSKAASRLSLGPTDVWISAFCELDLQAWQELGLPSALELDKHALMLRRDVAEAILPKGALEPYGPDASSVPIQAAPVGGHITQRLGRGGWRVSEGYVVGQGLLVRMSAH